MLVDPTAAAVAVAAGAGLGTVATAVELRAAEPVVDYAAGALVLEDFAGEFVGAPEPSVVPAAFLRVSAV